MLKKILLGVGVVFAGLIVLSVALSGGESTTDTPTSEAPPAAEAPAVEPTPEPTIAPEPAVEPTEEESQLEAEVEYLAEGGLLLDEFLENTDDYMIWSEEVLSEYELGVLYPDTTGGELALARTKDLAERVESLNVPPAYQEAHGFWVAANSEWITGRELAIAGVEQADADLMSQGNAHTAEGTRLMEESTAALERVNLGQ